MFESLMAPGPGSGRIVQPALSFTLHASVIAFAVGLGPDPVPEGRHDAAIADDVIWLPATPGTTTQVEPGPGTQLPRPPICDCPVPVPGPIQLDVAPGQRESIPGPPVSNPIVWSRDSIPGPGQPGVVGVYRDADLSDSPAIVHFPDPVYPPALRSAGVEGAVRVTYVVDAFGDVEPASITVDSTDHLSMANAVRAALVRARFRPGKVRGTPVRSLVRQTIRFLLMPL